MFAQTMGSTTAGVNGMLVTVEVDIANGLPGLEIVGLPDPSVKESRERVRAAIRNAGFEFPVRRITVNLAPADVRKDGSGLDLPIAVGILAASGQLDGAPLADYVFIGELSLEGRLRAASGVLPMAIESRRQGISSLVVPPDNAQEAVLGGTGMVYAPETLAELVLHLKGISALPCVVPRETVSGAVEQNFFEDFADVHGQVAAKRALEIAAAGGHNVLLVGPPGSGKTMLARRLTSILPPLSPEEALEVTKVYSVASLMHGKGLVTQRPFRSPHHTISDVGLIGGGKIPKPGEITLSHHGVLFLDEFPEFSRQVLEALRQPMEDGEVLISRASGAVQFPSRFMLVAAMNPCPCGYYGDDGKTVCTCSPTEINRYWKRVSGPLLDRIDLQVHVPRLKYAEITSQTAEETSSAIRERVEAAREMQRRRYSRINIACNAQLSHRQLKTYCAVSESAHALLEQTYTAMNLSARSYDRVLKVARTIADLERSERITEYHVAEAIKFRNNVRERFGI